MRNELERVELLLGEDAMKTLHNACVLVVGVGGVGSYAAESLARSGIGKLKLVDADTVALSNLNRQIMATYQSIDVPKPEAMKQRIQTYAQCEVECIQTFYDASKESILDGVDFVVDAIDTVSSKFDLIEACHNRKIPFVSSLGMGNRLDPSKIQYTKLSKTEYDPLAKACRMMAKKRKINYAIPVVFSTEQPRKQNQVVEPNGQTRKEKMPPASVMFVPAAAGLLCGSVALRSILEKCAS